MIGMGLSKRVLRFWCFDFISGFGVGLALSKVNSNHTTSYIQILSIIHELDNYTS